MELIKYPNEKTVDDAMSNDEPMLAVISFDGKMAVLSQIDETVEHHILLMKAVFRDTDIDKFFRIVFDREGADWTFVCPPDYSNITFKERRIRKFYNDGVRVITEFLKEIGYNTEIEIPKRYRRHLDMLSDD